MTEELTYPADFTEADRDKPLCGVLAVAAATGSTIEAARAAIAEGRGGRWKGERTYWPSDMQRALKAARRRSETVEEAERPISMALFNRRAKPDTTYLVHSAGHIMAYRNGWLLDQSGAAPFSHHWGRRKRVKGWIELKEK